MRNHQYLCTLLLTFSFSACAGNGESSLASEGGSAKTESELESSTSANSAQDLPDRWKSLSHNEWLEILSISSCDAEDQANESRRKNWIPLDDNTQLLLLTCELGAYQDAFHVYAVNTDLNTVDPVALQSSQRAGEAKEGDLVRGTLYKGEQGDVLELLHLSAATGACGWRALYPVEEVKLGGSVDPKAIFGDEDCYNGVTVDDWSAID